MAHFIYKRSMITLVLHSYHGSWGAFLTAFCIIHGPSIIQRPKSHKHITWNLPCHHQPGSTEFTHNFLQFSINIPFTAMTSFSLLRHQWVLPEPQPNESPWSFNRTQFFRIDAVFKAARGMWDRLYLLYFMYLGLPFSTLKVDFVLFTKTIDLASFCKSITICWSCLTGVIPRPLWLKFWVFLNSSATHFEFCGLLPRMACHIHCA